MIPKEALEKLSEINEKQKALDKEAKPYKDAVKSAMIIDGVGSVSEGSTVFTITNSTRTTFSKKDEFVSFLVKKGLKTCLVQSIEPDLDRLKMEIGVTITQVEFDTYVKQTPTQTFKIK